MPDTNRASLDPWAAKKANTLAALCLLMGVAGGWLIRGVQNHPLREFESPASVAAPASAGVAAPPQSSPAAPSAARLKQMADAQAAPLIDKLKSHPDNPELLTSIANLYYDAQQYPAAIDYYARALKARPSDAAVRTDMATAWWFLGNADTAIAEFNTALTYAPDSPNTLFNLGLAKWKGKGDVAGAISDWEKLLAANPHYEGKDKVLQMMADARKQAGSNVK